MVALISALAFATNLTLASVVYTAGGNVHALNLARSAAFTVLMLGAVVLARASLRMTRSQRAAACALGLLFCMELYAILLAIAFIPVGLAILIMYTYPLMVSAVAWLSGRERFTLDAGCAVLAAFAGLALALHSPEGLPDWRGVALALAAAVGLASLLIATERMLFALDRRVVVLHLSATATAAVVVVTAVLGELAWPAGTTGWLAFGGSTVFYALATFLLFAALELIGPFRTAVIDNAAPVFAIFLAAVLLDEHLSTVQIFGGALVIAAVVLVQIGAAVPVPSGSVRRQPEA